ncbi:DNA mismatch repair protein MSH1, mitochondrial-like isoform X1 [Salvia splendens]|uniref:DNA mismatch repair protein MSH1, mitochondrial-like isoform X1 n=2 Tax=Salvia splendens TaxID=180675 RepID=UPI001C25FD5A|nr:DNA mismatch repair protein MSH1, mitochondrial-like isoform X1 [Salvia splendens]
MYWLTARNAVVFVHRWRSLSFIFSPSLCRPSPTAGSPRHTRQPSHIFCFKERKHYTKTSKKLKESKISLEDKDYAHIIWWKEKLEMCRKPSSVLLVKRLAFTNLLGVDSTLKNGSLKEGNLNCEMLQFKSKFPREVLLCRVGDFYEAIGIDACILVEYAGLNPFGGLRSDSIPRAGCPVVNLRQTLDDLTRNGFSVCIVEEVQGPTHARTRKSRFISGHAHPGSPYVFGLVEDNHDLDFPDPMPVVGISRSAKGYCMLSVLETMKTYSVEDNLTEEALVAKLRTCRCHHMFLHTSLRNSSSGTCRWGEFGEGGLLWGECNARQFEWFNGDPVSELLYKVKELYGLEDNTTFRNVTVAPENRPSPLYLGTATQIGAIPTEGIPCLLRVLLPPSCVGLPIMYIRDLLLNPPAYEIASKVQEACKSMSNITCSIPEFTCVPSAKLVKLLELRETNHIEFCKIKSVLDDIIQLYSNSELREILKLLMDPTWVATGLKVELETLVSECRSVSSRISEIISLDGESDQKITSSTTIPNEFFEDLESSWKGRVKRIHLEEEFAEVDEAAKALSVAIKEDFIPIISRIKAVMAPLGGPKGEILYAREHEAVWFKGKRFAPIVHSDSQIEEKIKQLRPALDSKGKKVGEEWFTTIKVEDALTRYHEAGDKAKRKVLELLRELSVELQTKINVLVFASMLLVIAKALFGHVSEGRRRKWVFPTLTHHHKSEDTGMLHGAEGMKFVRLSPYWFDAAQGGAVRNTFDMKSLFLLTGPNGGGKSSLLRSICAAALLGMCGLMIPAESAIIPHFDAIMLHMKSYDSPADGKSSFQVEMSEIRSIITRATSKSLVLIDEICRGTETAKGTCIAGGVIETLDAVSCLGIVSTHLHGIFDLPLKTKNVVFKAMGAEHVNNQTVPTWKLIDGVCRESLAFETAQREGVPSELIERAKELYAAVYAKDSLRRDERFSAPTIVDTSNMVTNRPSHPEMGISPSVKSVRSAETLSEEVEKAVISICEESLMELYKKHHLLEPSPLRCVLIGAKEQPPPSTIGASSVYIMLRPDRKLYIGETDDLQGRICTHRAKEGMQKASFLYMLVAGKSVACQMETLLINQLPARGFQITNLADGKHRNFGTSDVLGSEMMIR